MNLFVPPSWHLLSQRRVMLVCFVTTQCCFCYHKQQHRACVVESADVEKGACINAQQEARIIMQTPFEPSGGKARVALVFANSVTSEQISAGVAVATWSDNKDKRWKSRWWNYSCFRLFDCYCQQEQLMSTELLEGCPAWSLMERIQSFTILNWINGQSLETMVVQWCLKFENQKLCVNLWKYSFGLWIYKLKREKNVT